MRRIGLVHENDATHAEIERLYRYDGHAIPKRNVIASIDECILWLTGYYAMNVDDIGQSRLLPMLGVVFGGHRSRWAWALHRVLRPAYTGYRGRYYFVRDILRVVAKAKRDARRSKERLRRRKELAEREREGWLLASVQLTAVKKLLREMTLEV